MVQSDLNSILKSEGNWCRWGLAAIILFFLLWRIPIVLREAGGQDEEWFAIPGWTIWQEGIPRVPYAPQRQTGSAFYKADEALFALPPLFYYVSAPLYAVLPPTYSTTRLVSVAAGAVLLIFIYLLARRVFQDPLAGLIGAGLFSLSRPFYFPATISRPDMLCGMWGLAALWMMWRWYDQQKRPRDLALTGVFLGLGMLTHPFALVFCIQIGLWSVLAQGTLRERLTRGALLTGCALAVFALWLPLILAYPEAFRLQFFTNVLNRSGPGLISRLFFPWPYFTTQFQLLQEHAGNIQLVLMAAGLFWGTWLAARSDDRRTCIFMALVWSSLYLLIACQGTHPTKGYWCYPGALLFLCLGWGLSHLVRNLWAYNVAGRMVSVAGLALFVLAMLPGSGIRTGLAHLKNWSNPNYNAPRFVSQILNDLPPDARYTVDRAYVFNFAAAGRPTLLSDVREFAFDARPFPYDYLIVSHDSKDREISKVLNARRIQTYGDPNDPFSCYIEVYVPQDRPVQEQNRSDNTPHNQNDNRSQP
ncbi:Dolichyl-phosphate-mannose-protein mannosyltransferase [Gimesia alba]|uniref:Dolichyl-phosphate-mannose-protein mannosyltransferase n=1 Tax=Gimesia alba TaxID=2527973 RepID=A0A517RL93_9PLAN|nr:glycosyltransferase family 39 protein [Gimesia alba]QDT44647.1 Dolichyl-phosphate-mannose-protein mannosyltransferase [Gimesia alba]